MVKRFRVGAMMKRKNKAMMKRKNKVMMKRLSPRTMVMEMVMTMSSFLFGA